MYARPFKFYLFVMIWLAIRLAADGDEYALTIPLSPDYGQSAEVAHLVLGAALTAEWPLVVDATGEVHRFPTDSVRSFAVVETPDP